MAIRILVMGLPGSGKTTFTEELIRLMASSPLDAVEWFNADQIRKKYNDWDFSESGRIRQAQRMRDLSDNSNAQYCIADFVCPLPEMRNIFKADWVIWLDTINAGRYEDTNKAFIEPDLYDFRIPEQNAEKWAKYCWERISNNQRRPIFDWKKETVQMLGRWQPWHQGHRALFERALAKTGQVVIQIRDCQGWQASNPFGLEQVKNYIRHDLDPLYQGQYEIQVVPNIVNITYGRDVGYKIEQESFDKSITDISATKIRKELGVE